MLNYFIFSKIPLVPRRPKSQDVGTVGAGGTGAAGGTKAGLKQGNPKDSKINQKADKYSPPPPEDIDEKLIFDAHKTAFNFINMIVNTIFSFKSCFIIYF